MSDRPSTTIFQPTTLAWIAAALFLAVSLVSYDPLDPPAEALYPPRTVPLNWAGTPGAWVAGGLVAAVGWMAYYFAASAVVAAWTLIRGGELREPVLRTVGWLLTLVGLCTLASLTFPAGSAGPHVGPGGWLGAMGRAWVEAYFATAGAYLFSFSVIAAGTVLVSEAWFFRLSWWLTLGAPAWLVGWRKRRIEETRARDEAAKVYPVASGEGPKVNLGGVPFGLAEAGSEGYAVAEEAPKKGGKGDKAKREEAEALSASAAAEAASAGSDAAAEAPPARALRVNPPPTRDLEKEPRGETKEEEKRPVVAAAASTAEPVRKAPPPVAPVAKAPAAPPAPKAAKKAFELPSIELLTPGEPIRFEEHEADVRRKATILEKTFANFGFNVKVVEIDTGPVIAQFEVELEAGLRLSKITSLADDLAIALRVPSVRIVAPIPGKNTVGIEVPNKQRQMVRMRDVMEASGELTKKMRIPIFLGQDVSGKPLVTDLTAMPHLLIAGRTGTGKSVCLNTIIGSILMAQRPDEVQLLLIDPKMVELISYARIPHLMHPVVTDMKKAEAILGWAVEKMEERYALLARAGVRHISGYNQLGQAELAKRLMCETEEEEESIPKSLPYIVIIADEMADLMMTAAKEVETHIIRLAQKSRAVGIHLVLATQKPTVDVITGLIKSNLPARISFQVASRTDSRVVLDEMGADKLLGSGDMLYLSPQTSTLLRGQGTYISDEEINQVCAAVATSEPNYVQELVKLKPKDEEGKTIGGIPKNRDDLYESAIEVVIREGRGSVSLLQRALGVGYGRAARLVDYMAEDGVVGDYNGSQAREVLLTIEQWEEMQAESRAASSGGKKGKSSEPARSASKPRPESSRSESSRMETSRLDAGRAEPRRPEPSRTETIARAATGPGKPSRGAALSALADDDPQDFDDLFLDRDQEDEDLPTMDPVDEFDEEEDDDRDDGF